MLQISQYILFSPVINRFLWLKKMGAEAPTFVKKIIRLFYQLMILDCQKERYVVCIQHQKLC